ncbi:hypothetical protein [Herbaspirillum frisingense]|nr:hypothetical protein [Herbaspirillum frisingense]
MALDISAHATLRQLGILIHVAMARTRDVGEQTKLSLVHNKQI